MQGDSDILEYRFSDFCVKENRQSISKDGQTLAAGTKIYYLLLLFVKNSGTVLSKDKIIEAVWPGQIVTDAALTKQVLRLRKLLDDSDPQQPIIETHRGAGYRFTAPVEVVLATHDSAPPERAPIPASQESAPTSRLGWLAYIGFAALIVAVYFAASGRQREVNSVPNVMMAKSPVRMAIIPSQNGQDWLNRGGLDYFSKLLGHHEGIQAISPQPDWYTSESPEHLAIALTTHKNINYSCLINIRETAGGFELHAKLRTDSEVISKTTLSAATLPLLFDKADKWIGVNVLVSDQLDNARSNTLLVTEDNYALRSYLQGIFELEVSGDGQTASEYFQAAVNKDKSFLSAWVKLAETSLALSKFEKAITIADTHLIRSGINDGSNADSQLHFIKAVAYTKLTNPHQALESIRASIASIEKTEDPYKKLIGLKALTFFERLHKNWDGAEMLTQERLSITEDFLPLPNKLAALHMELAQLYRSLGKGEKTRKQIDEAIRYYDTTANASGMIVAYSVLNQLNFVEGNYDQGLQVIALAEPYIASSNASFELMMYYQVSTLILNLRGEFERSELYRKQMKKIAEQTNNKLYLQLSEFVIGHRYYVENKFLQAKNHMESVSVGYRNNKFLASSEEHFATTSILISSRVDTAKETLSLMNQYLLKHPQLKERFPVEISRAEGHISVTLGNVEEGVNILKKTEQIFRDKGEIGVANYVGYEVLEILLAHPSLEYQETIARLEANTSYDYLFFKLKAQFEAREGNYLASAMLMQENKLRANQLWRPEDQLLLEDYQHKSL